MYVMQYLRYIIQYMRWNVRNIIGKTTLLYLSMSLAFNARVRFPLLIVEKHISNLHPKELGARRRGKLIGHTWDRKQGRLSQSRATWQRVCGASTTRVELDSALLKITIIRVLLRIDMHERPQFSSTIKSIKSCFCKSKHLLMYTCIVLCYDYDEADEA